MKYQLEQELPKNLLDFISPCCNVIREQNDGRYGTTCIKDPLLNIPFAQYSGLPCGMNVMVFTE